MKQNVLLAQEEVTESYADEEVSEALMEKYLLFHSGGLLFGIPAQHVV